MKNHILFFMFSVAGLAGVQAQSIDTIDRPTQDYYCPNWIGDSPQFDTQYIVMNVVQGCRDGDVTKLCHTDDTLTVYGVAAALEAPESRLDGGRGRGNGPISCLDTSYANCYEFLRVYSRGDDGNPVEITGSRVNIADAPEHYMYIGRKTRVISTLPRRVYEVYFEKGAVDVVGDFFVGVTQHLKRDTMVDGHQYHFTWPIHLVDINYTAGWLPDICTDIIYCHGGPEYPWWVANGHVCPFIFPIVTPPGGQEGVEEADEMARYVYISPNPASDVVKITSSFEMKQIEVFNSAGKQTLEQEVSGLQTRIDVGAWLGGTYVVRVHTVWGTITKKLLIAKR